ncbi:MAG: DUF222 domain-containing protein [Actinobacteria bacterium]|nr:DUF222 domain-containing protein [Actinomycetota bacterium]
MSSILRTFPSSSAGSGSKRGKYGVSDIQEARTDRVSILLRETPCIAVLAELIGIDPLKLEKSARIDYLAALERQSSWLQAAMQKAILAVAGEEPSVADDVWKGVDDAEREDVATALRLSGTTAQMRIDVARTLVNHLPNTCSALASGEISPAHATVIARETASAIRNGISPFAISVVEERALAHAEFHTPSQVANKVRTTLARIAPEEFEETTSNAYDTRRVSCYKEADGMSTIVAILPALDAQFVMSAIESLVFKSCPSDFSGCNSHQFANDTRTMEMKRADALSELAQKYLTSNEPVIVELIDQSNESTKLGLPHDYQPLDTDVESTIETSNQSHAEGERAKGRVVGEKASGPVIGEKASGHVVGEVANDHVNGETAGRCAGHHSPKGRVRRRPITVNVTIDLPTLLGFANNPGQLAGYGAIPASLARELASNSQWRRFITDPKTGALLDYGRETYEPPQPLVDFLLARDRTCRFPGCRAPARSADLDHAQSWESGGETSPQNLGALCRRHHRLKTHGGWKLESNADGSCTWTSPENKNFFVPARDAQEAV